MKVRTFSFILLSAAMAGQALAHGDSIHLHLSNGTPSVGLLSDADGSVTPMRAFLATWNWSTSQGAFSTADPGWSWDTNFQESDTLSFKVLTSLQRWNGTTFVDAPFDARIRLGTQSVLTTEALTQGFSEVIGANDHFHYRYNLHGVSQADPNANGVYRLNFLASRVSGSTTVDYPAFGIVLNRGMDAATAQSAVSYANANPVPEPATMTALGLGTLALLRRRKR